jgi:chromosome segregation ATPase
MHLCIALHRSDFFFEPFARITTKELLVAANAKVEQMTAELLAIRDDIKTHEESELMLLEELEKVKVELEQVKGTNETLKQKLDDSILCSDEFQGSLQKEVIAHKGTIKRLAEAEARLIDLEAEGEKLLLKAQSNTNVLQEEVSALRDSLQGTIQQSLEEKASNDGIIRRLKRQVTDLEEAVSNMMKENDETHQQLSAVCMARDEAVASVTVMLDQHTHDSAQKDRMNRDAHGYNDLKEMLDEKTSEAYKLQHDLQQLLDKQDQLVATKTALYDVIDRLKSRCIGLGMTTREVETLIGVLS